MEGNDSQKYEIETDNDVNTLTFRQVKNPDKEGQPVKVNIKNILAEAFKQDATLKDIAQYDISKNHIHSGPMNLTELDKNHGIFYYAVGRHFIAFEKEAAFDLMTGKLTAENIKSKILFKQSYGATIGYIKLDGRKLILNIGDEILVKQLVDSKTLSDLYSFKLPNLKGQVFLKQISCSKQRVLMITSDLGLFEFDEGSQKLTKCPIKCRSAIYNQNFSHVIALLDMEQETQSHLFIFKSGKLGGNPEQQIKMHCPKAPDDFFRAYFMTDFENGYAFIYAAFYADQGDKDDNVGSALVFIIQGDVGPATKWEGDLKERTQFYSDTELQHSNDEDDSLPIVKAQWMVDPKANSPKDEKMAVLQLNHQVIPHIFWKKANQNKFVACYYLKPEHRVEVNRPMKADGISELFESTDCLGTVQGFSLVTCALSDKMKDRKYEYKLVDFEENWCYPPILAMYGLDGKIYTFHVFLEYFKEKSCITDTKPIEPIKDAPKPANQPSSLFGNPSRGSSLIESKSVGFAGFGAQSSSNPVGGQFGQVPKAPNDVPSGIFDKPAKQPNADDSKLGSDKSTIQPQDVLWAQIQANNQQKEEEKKQEQPQKDRPANQNAQKFDGKEFEQLQKQAEQKQKEQQEMLEKLRVEVHKPTKLKARQIFVNLDTYQPFINWLSTMQKMTEAQYDELEDAQKLKVNKIFESDQIKLHKKEQAQKNEVIKQEQDIKAMKDQHKQTVQRQDKSIKELKQYNFDAPPTINVLLLDIEKQLTEKYNSTVVKEIKQFQEMVAKDLKRLPKIDEHLLDEEKMEQQKRPIDLMKDELKKIGLASVEKDKFLGNLNQIKHDKFVSEQILGDHQTLKRDLVNDPSIHEIFQQLDKQIKALEKKNDPNDKLMLQKLNQTVKKSKDYCLQFDRANHLIEGIQMVDQVFKEQILQNGILSEYDLKNLQVAVDKKKQEAQQFMRHISFNVSQEMIPPSRAYEKQMEQEQIIQNTSKFLTKNLEIQGMFMKEIIENIDERLEAIKALYQKKQVKEQNKYSLNDSEFDLNQSIISQTSQRTRYGISDSDEEEQESEQASYSQQYSQSQLDSVSEQQTDKKAKRKLKKKEFFKKFKEGKIQIHTVTVEFKEPKKESPKHQIYTEFEQWDVDFNNQIKNITLRDEEIYRKQVQDRVIQFKPKPIENYILPPESRAAAQPKMAPPQLLTNPKAAEEQKRAELGAQQFFSQRSMDQEKEMKDKLKHEKALDNDLLKNSDNGSNLSGNKPKVTSEFDTLQIGHVSVPDKVPKQNPTTAMSSMLSFGGMGQNPLQKNQSVLPSNKLDKALAFQSPKVNVEAVDSSSSQNESESFLDPSKSTIFGAGPAPTLTKSISSMPQAAKPLPKDKPQEQPKKSPKGSLFGAKSDALKISSMDQKPLTGLQKSTSFLPKDQKPPTQELKGLFDAQTKTQKPVIPKQEPVKVGFAGFGQAQSNPTKQGGFDMTAFSKPQGQQPFGGGGFGQMANQDQKQQFGSSSAASIAANKNTQQPQKTFGSAFGGGGATFASASNPTQPGGFGQTKPQNQSAAPTFGSFSSQSQQSKPLTFGQGTQQSQPLTFGQGSQNTGGSILSGGFGSGGGFGSQPQSNPGGGFLGGQNPPQQNPPGSMFGGGSMFGQNPSMGMGQGQLAQNTERDPFASGSSAPQGFGGATAFGGVQAFGSKPPAGFGAGFGKPRK